jgi:hypothetical protein
MTTSARLRRTRRIGNAAAGEAVSDVACRPTKKKHDRLPELPHTENLKPIVES